MRALSGEPSAVPLALASLTFVDYPARQCGYEIPAWVAAEEAAGNAASRRYQEARRILHYARIEDRRYVHLVDGGLADNLGLRALFDKATYAGGFVALTELTGYTRFRRVLHIIVLTPARPTGT